MRYMTDAQLSGLAPELRGKGVDCETVHKLLRGHEDTSVSISDPEILRYLVSQQGSVTLVTLDNELVEYCRSFNVPVIRVQDLIASYILGPKRG
jgi:rRNA-processing protein FCF1